MNRRNFLAASTALSVAPAGAAKAVTTLRAGALPMPPTRNALPSLAWNEEPGRLLLDRGWYFHAGDIPFPNIRGHGWTYANAKAGQAQGAASMTYDDSEWAKVDLPHDWASEQPIEESANVSQGYRKRGFGWYRRPLRLEAEDRGKYLELQFGAIATNATIWFNGTLVAHNWSGYNSINVDVTPMARYGDDINSIVVRVDAEKMEGWWYEGAGIYRHVWLAKRASPHIATDGVYADPVKGADGSWTVPVEVTLGNVSAHLASVTVEAVLTDASGQIVAQKTTEAMVAPLIESRAKLSLAVPDPALWSIETPHLYVLTTRLLRNGQSSDERVIRIGFRTIRFDAERGFFLNGVSVKIKGVCNHQDHAGVGVAIPDSLTEWRIQRLKDLGCNAIRSAHNAPSVEFLDACDRLGMMVMDENRLFNTSSDYMEQLRWLVRRDRNRPCVIMWSVFNEEPMQATEAGYEMVRRMVSEVKLLDASRPVTAAMNSGIFAPKNVSQTVDVVGFNYQISEYDRFHAANPALPLLSSEDTSSFMTRGAFETDRAKHIMSSYDEEPASWGSSHRQAWKLISERPFVAGTFVWTGFDYHGEPSPFEWPSNSSFFGIMDLCGFPKTAFHLHRAQWVDDTPVLEITPHWNWAGREGQPIKVWILTNADRVVLSLNGKTISEQRVDRHVMPSWQVPYQPGRLEAVGYRGSKEVIRAAVETTGDPVSLRLTPDRSRMRADGEDAQPFTVDAVDSRGRHVPTANLPVEFSVRGGTIIGLGNGDPNSLEPEKGSRRNLFNGLAQVIVRADGGAPGILDLAATAPGLKAAKSSVQRVAAAPRPFVELTAPVVLLDSWRQSPASTLKPDPHTVLADNDMNSWLWMRPGEPQRSPGAGDWQIMRTKFTPRKRTREKGGRLVFANLAGRAEVWVNGKRVAEKPDYEARKLSAPLPPGDGERVVSVLIEKRGAEPVGFLGLVFVEED